jgi:hypothetical protein
MGVPFFGSKVEEFGPLGRAAPIRRYKAPEYSNFSIASCFTCMLAEQRAEGDHAPSV